MPRHALTALLVFACLSGCSVRIDRTVHAPPQDHRTHEHRADALVLKEIKAAAALPSPSNRFALLDDIAKRDGLEPHTQVVLVETAFAKLPFHQERVALLNSLIDNPAFSQAAHHAILDDIKRLPFESDRLSVLKKLSKIVHEEPQPADQPPPDPSGSLR